MTSSKVNQQNYNLWSSNYDDYPNPTVAIDEMSFPQLYQHWEGQNILEIGCGTGRHSVRLDKNNSLVGIDVSDGMLDKAREKLPNATFVHGDFMEQGFDDQVFDKIIMSLVLEHISDLNRFFEKTYSLLADGGEIFISEIHPKRSNEGTLAHFKNSEGEDIHLSSRAHSEEEIFESAQKVGFQLEFKKDVLGNEKLGELKEKWKKYLNEPMIQIWSFKK